MVRPNFGHRGMTPIRSGQQLVLGYEVTGAVGEGRYYVAPRGVGGARRATWFPLDGAGWASAWRAFEEAEPGNAADYRRRLEAFSSTAVGEGEPLSVAGAARRTLSALLVIGGLVSALGVTMFFGFLLNGRGDPDELTVFVVLGALVTLAGIALLLVGLIGWGVKLGREAADA
jgi:hypothetical protein